MQSQHGAGNHRATNKNNQNQANMLTCLRGGGDVTPNNAIVNASDSHPESFMLCAEFNEGMSLKHQRRYY